MDTVDLAIIASVVVAVVIVAAIGFVAWHFVESFGE